MDRTITSVSSQLFILFLALPHYSESQLPLSWPTVSSRRSLNNIFNRTSAQQNVNVTTEKNEIKVNTYDDRDSVNVMNHFSINAVSDSIVPQRRRRLGVGARNRPSDDFVEGNENIHRFFDKMLLSMKTEAPTKSPVMPSTPVPIPVILPTTNPIMFPSPVQIPSPVVVPSPTVMPVNTTTAPTSMFVCVPQITKAKREELILSILNDITPESQILTTGTSQNKAFNWLVNIDELKLCPDRGSDIMQRYGLAVLYFSSGGDDWLQCSALMNSSSAESCIDQERYLSKSSVCDWFNVTCSTGGNITGIVLDDNNLVGILPNELQALDQLVNISFSNNTMVSGSIPSSYGSLSALKRLDASNNVVMGTIPATICNATSLQYIDLKMNILAGTIPKCIGELAALSSLILDRNILTGALPTELNRLSSLEILSMSENGLTGTIPITLGSNVALREVSLQQNSISGSLPAFVGLLTNMESLNLFFNQMNGTIPTELGRLNQLENLFLHFNEFSGTMPDTICALRDAKNGILRQLTSDCGSRGRVVCPVDCCTACF